MITHFIIHGALLVMVGGTNRYYNSYLSYGSGDTIILNFHIHGGPTVANRAWNCECLDGQAMVGIADYVDDFEVSFGKISAHETMTEICSFAMFVQRLQQTWCKSMFPDKPAAGMYPYYAGCHVRNYTNQYFCMDPFNAEKTANTFITGLWSNSFFWFVYFVPQNNNQLYKCCRPPSGYYIDYVSCYYMPTHDFEFEYYDSVNNFIVLCATGFVMTGISKKINPYSKEYHIEWIQCCRIGFGPPQNQVPPVIQAPSGAMSYYSSQPRLGAGLGHTLSYGQLQQKGLITTKNHQNTSSILPRVLLE